MRFTTRATYRSIDDFTNGRTPTVWEGLDHDGAIAELKKGRGALNNAANSAGTNVNNAQGVEQATNNIAQASTNTTGGLSPLVSKQLAGEKAQIAKSYQGAGQAAQRGLAMRGIGSAPSGTNASIANTAVNNAGNAETGATTNAFATQNQLNNTAYNPVISAINAGTGAVNSETGAGTALNKAGSTLGDIGTGLSGLAGIANSLYVPGPVTNFNPSIWKGGPTYMPGGGPAPQAPYSPLNLPT